MCAAGTSEVPALLQMTPAGMLTTIVIIALSEHCLSKLLGLKDQMIQAAVGTAVLAYVCRVQGSPKINHRGQIFMKRSS
jgi:hypothetical protein